jgi:hypothetical protein
MKYLINHYYSDLFRPKYRKNLTTSDKRINHRRIKVTEHKNKQTGEIRYSNVYYSGCEKDDCCILTGYGMDYDILKPIYNFLKKPCKHTTFEDLIKECGESWLNAVNADYEYQQSFEYISETLSANEYDFLEYGEMY